jgi:hypothetical protein
MPKDLRKGKPGGEGNQAFSSSWIGNSSSASQASSHAWWTSSEVAPTKVSNQVGGSQHPLGLLPELVDSVGRQRRKVQFDAGEADLR